MPEAAQIIGALAALLLIGSVGIWAARLRGPMLQRLDGKRVSNAGPAKLVILIMAGALGLSVVAAALAVVGWITP